MILDSRSDSLPGTIESDICVIGAGAAGITCALELEASGLQVCLLETGGFSFDDDITLLASGEIQGTPYYDLEASRLRYFGGTTMHWSGWSRPLDDIVFSQRDYVDGGGWPITRDALWPHYQRALAYIQLEGHSFELADNLDRLPAYFDQLPEESGLTPLVWHSSPPTRFGSFYRKRLEAASNIQVILHSTVTRLQNTSAGQDITFAEVADVKGSSFRVQAKQFVIASGGIEVPRLLLASATDAGYSLGNANDQVGRYFMMHPHLDIGQMLCFDFRRTALVNQPPPERYEEDGETKMKRVRAGVSLTPSLQRQEKLANHAIMFRRAEGPSAEAAGSFTDRGHATAVQAMQRQFTASASQAGPEQVYVDLEMRMEHLPSAESRLRLGSGRDALGMPLPILDWRAEPEEFAGMRRTAEMVAARLSTLSLGRVYLRDWLFREEGSWPDHVNWDYHHMGGTRMHASPAQGVLDGNCKVHGVNNLFVAGSAAFTTGCCSNPTLTIVALATRLADHLKTLNAAGIQA